MPSKLVPKTPYEPCTSIKPNLGNFLPWASVAYVHSSFSHKHKKLGPSNCKCIFIRYSEDSNGYALIGEKADGMVSKIDS